MRKINSVQKLKEKKETLNQSICELKAEFFGIDEIIDEVVRLVTPWYILDGNPDRRPTVLALWGMSGVGKSALVDRLSCLLSLEEVTATFDMGEVMAANPFWLKNELTDSLEDLNCKKSLIVLDEMHLCRTINPGGFESERDNSRVIWQLIDTGRIMYERLGTNYADLFRLEQMLSLCLKKGVKANKGFVVEKHRLFGEILNKMMSDFISLDFEEAYEELLFIPNEYYSDILSVEKNRFSTEFELQGFLVDMNEVESHNFICELLSKMRSPRMLDLSASLIVIIGNIDELYPMANVVSSDVSIDSYHADTQNITLEQVKTALQKRFRNEQIARMGNNHIWYPALSAKAYRQIIKKEFKRVILNFLRMYGVRVDFDQTVHDLVYKEGVTPMHGARPLLSSIQSIVDSYCARILSDIALKYSTTDSIHWAYDCGKYIITLKRKSGKVIRCLKYDVPVKNEIGQNKINKSLVALVALHESAHALISVLRTKILPTEVKVALGNLEQKGYTIHEFDNEINSNRSLQDRIAIALAGYCGEKLVFGKLNISTGSKDDIQRATSYASVMIKSCGFGKDINFISIPSLHTNDALFTQDHHEDQVKSMLKLIEEEVNMLLTSEKVALLKLAEVLSTTYVLNGEDVKKILMKYASIDWVRNGEFISSDSYFPYEEVLNKEFAEENLLNLKN